MPHKSDYSNPSDNHNARGVELADRGWLDEATLEFRKAIELDPNSAEAHANLGMILAEKGDYLNALFEFVEGVKADPEDPSLHHYLGSFIAQYHSDFAVSQFKKSIELSQEYPEAHLSLGIALMDENKPAEALQHFEIAHEQAPEIEHIQHELAYCLIELQRFPEAINHLKQIIKGYPDHIEAYTDLGVAYTAQGFYAEAESTLQRALVIDAHDLATHYQTAALYAVWDKNEKALEHLEIIAKHDQEKLRSWLEDEPLFDALHEEPRFKKLIEL